MRITEIKWENGKQYKVGGLVYTVKDEDILVYSDIRGEEISITEYLTLKELLEADFTEVIDWSKVAVDTKIRVRDNKNQKWKNRYFAKYEIGQVYTWNDGTTSWSANSERSVNMWEYAELVE